MSWEYQDIGKMEAEIDHLKHSTQTLTEIINRWSQTYTPTTYADYDDLKDFKNNMIYVKDELMVIAHQTNNLIKQATTIQETLKLPLWQNYGKDHQ